MPDERAQTHIVPTGTWDTHLHILDPEAFPYDPNRLYTPAAAGLDELLASTFAECFLLVQASVEDGTSGILSHLQKARAQFQTRTFRAEIEIPPRKTYTDTELEQLIDLGVRAIRLHGVLGRNRSNRTLELQEELTRLAVYARRTNWFLSCMFDLETWNELGPWLASSSDFQSVRFIAEHNARIDPLRSGADYPELDNFLNLASQNSSKFFVKICGLNRLETKRDTPGRIAAIPSPVLAIIKALPDQVIWGSDWPHTHFENDSLDKVPNKKVDLQNEVSLLNQTLSSEAFQKLFVRNAEILFR